MASLNAARCRLAFLQQSLLNLDAGDGVLEDAAGVADDASIAVLDAMQALEQEAFSLPKRSKATKRKHSAWARNSLRKVYAALAVLPFDASA